MNRGGQAIFFLIMFAIIVIVLALALAPSIGEFISDTRNETQGSWSGGQPGLNCTSTTISDFNKGACLITDITLPYFIGFLLALAGAVVGAKLVIGG